MEVSAGDARRTDRRREWHMCSLCEWIRRPAGDKHLRRHFLTYGVLRVASCTRSANFQPSDKELYYLGYYPAVQKVIGIDSSNRWSDGVDLTELKSTGAPPSLIVCLYATQYYCLPNARRFNRPI